MRRSNTFVAVALAAASVVSAQAAEAQSLLLPGMLEKGVWIEATHTSFEEFDVDAPSSVIMLSGRLPVGSRFGVTVDLPFSYASYDVDGGDESNTVFGNPYVGVDVAALEGLMVEVGTRLPLNTADAESVADLIAAVADPFRAEAFLDDQVPLLASATYSYPLASGFGIRARAGVATLFYTGDEDDRDTESVLDYGLVGTYTAGPAQLALGVAGRWDAGADEGDFTDNSVHQAALSADVEVGSVRPGVSVRVPLDSNFGDVVKSSVGFYLRVPMP